MTTLTILFAVLVPVFHILGVISAVNAVMETRTGPGAVAWVVSLVTFPYVAVPLYWVFGRSTFHGYVQAARSSNIAEVTRQVREAGHVDPFWTPDGHAHVEPLRSLEAINWFRFTGGNHADILVDGDATFEAIFAAIGEAKDYVVLQFFIVKDDDIGRRLRDLLLRKAAEGVRILFLYDEVGSHGLAAAYPSSLAAAGIRMSTFHTTKGKGNRFQINFRNHRKIVVVDGRVGFTGGLNVGDEYLGKSTEEKLRPWRDTMVRLEGPIVQELQAVFLVDWYWATGEIPELKWKPQPSGTNWDGVIIPSGPADKVETCSIFFSACASAARDRLWIASPYFVPDQAVTNSLTLAAMRGVDVRILLPANADHWAVWLARHTFIQAMEDAGVKLFEHIPGFMHQKVVLVDTVAAAIGSANLDNRSLRLNFEVMALIANPAFASAAASMLQRDFRNSRSVTAADYAARPFWFRLAARVTRLFEPIL